MSCIYHMLFLSSTCSGSLLMMSRSAPCVWHQALLELQVSRREEKKQHLASNCLQLPSHFLQIRSVEKKIVTIYLFYVTLLYTVLYIMLCILYMQSTMLYYILCYIAVLYYYISLYPLSHIPDYIIIYHIILYNVNVLH